MKKVIYCPMCDVTCPYCVGLEFECTIDDPYNECDDYYYSASAYINTESEDEEE